MIQKAPFRGAEQTAKLIRESALSSQKHFAVRRLAEEICRDLRSKDYLSEILAIYHFVLTNTRYMRDPKTVELVKAPWRTVTELLSGRRPQLDCDDLTALLSALLLSVGCSVRIVIVAFKNIKFNGERQYSHVFCQALEPKSGKWITVDPVGGERTSKMHGRVKFAKIFMVA